MKQSTTNNVDYQSGKKKTIGYKTIKSIYRETMKLKGSQDIRVLLCNINFYNVKTDIYRCIAMNEVDINLLNEVNKDQRALEQKDRTGEIVKNWWNRMVCTDEYLIDIEVTSVRDDSRQQGGVATILNNDIISHVSAQGGNKRHSGQWRWITIQGKGNVRTTSITCYHPGNGWITQDNQLAKIRASEEGKKQLLQVSKLWFNDLEEIIREHKSRGQKIMLAGDFNDDIRNKSSTKVRKWAE